MPTKSFIWAAVLGAVGLAVSWQEPAESNEPTLRIETKDLGPMATGSNMFRCGLVHSSSVIYIGTYGPAPALVWKYDPRTGALAKVGTPGEYQLDSMVEAPNRKVYIGTAYSGLVYELDPKTEAIRSLGTPPVDSTSWIFTMICTREGEIFGAKGVGLFRLDWRTGRMESCGIVPGNHWTGPPNSGASSPITRTLEQRSDGLIWGDTNRWIFTFDPKTRKIKPLVDVQQHDEACYAVIHPFGQSPIDDLWFSIYPRFSGKLPRNSLCVYRTATGKIEPVELGNLPKHLWPCGWWNKDGKWHWLASWRDDDTQKSEMLVIDVQVKRVVERWEVPGNGMWPTQLTGPGLWFFSGSRGTLFRADPEHKRLIAVAENPSPVQCVSLAASRDGRLGAYTYDCGFAFTYDLKTGKSADHGRVNVDDHRSPVGPAAFAGKDARYFVANHSVTVPKLWVTDTKANRHWAVGAPAAQLVAFQDGTVWGITDSSPAVPWTPAKQAGPGILFRYRPGEAKADVFGKLGPVGPILESPGQSKGVLVGMGKKLGLFSPRLEKRVAEADLPSALSAMASDGKGGLAYLVLSDGALLSCSITGDRSLAVTNLGVRLGATDRGCFVLPQSRRLVAIGKDGKASTFDPRTRAVQNLEGPAPLPTGPAVHPTEDVWFFAGRQLVRCSPP